MGVQLGVTTVAYRPNQKWRAILDAALELCVWMDPAVCAYYVMNKRHVELRNTTRNSVRAAASRRLGLHALATEPIGAALRDR